MGLPEEYKYVPDDEPTEERPTDQGPYAPYDDPHPGQDGYPRPEET